MKALRLHFRWLLLAWALVAHVSSASAQTAAGCDTLNTRQQCIVRIAASTGIGDLERLKPALAEGLDGGMTVNEIREILVHAYAYCGFPRSIRALQTFLEVLDERKA